MNGGDSQPVLVDRGISCQVRCRTRRLQGKVRCHVGQPCRSAPPPATMESNRRVERPASGYVASMSGTRTRSGVAPPAPTKSPLFAERWQRQALSARERDEAGSNSAALGHRSSTCSWLSRVGAGVAETESRHGPSSNGRAHARRGAAGAGTKLASRRRCPTAGTPPADPSHGPPR